MRTNCFCLRPRSHLWPDDSEVYRTGVNRGTTPGLQPPVRAVSPADVRRTASGRIVKQRGDATLHTARDPPASMHVHVLGGRQLTECCNIDHSSGHNVNAQRQNDRPVASRILQPSDKVLAVGKQHRTFLQHLQPLKRKTDLGGKPSTAVATPVLSKSILEASVRRMERHKQHLDVFDDLLQPAAVQTFIDAYLLALAEANQHWADVPEIAALFTPDTILKTQDKQTFHGKTAVLRRLNSGSPQCMMHYNGA